MGLAENIITAMLPHLQKAASTIGDETVTDIKGELGKRQYPPLSGPPEVGPPARRKGHLQDGVGHTQETLSTSVVETIHSTRPQGNSMVPEWMERGTPDGRVARRPYMKPARDRLAETISVRLAELLK